jgi:spermidine/putrescine transport system ATP-binding protein
MTTLDLECSRLTKRFGDATAVNDVSFEVPTGSFFSILGPSGCGKTTIMRMIAGFLEPTGGDIRIKGRSVLDVPPNERPVNMVFQHLALFPMMTIADNIGYGLRRKGMRKAEIARKVGEVLERIGLPDIGPRKVDELSGGQKQRVAIARCMVLEPDVLLLDEPLGALDLKLREHMKIELKALQAAFDTTFLYITHDQSEALVMSDQIAVMNAGRFEQIGDARELYYRPETAFVASFVGDSNRWRGRVARLEGEALELRSKSGLAMRGTRHGRHLAEGDAADVFVRPEAIRIGHAAEDVAQFDNRLSGQVTSLLFNGAASRILVRPDAGGEEIEVALPQSGEFAGLVKGAMVHLGWAADQSNCFAAGEA